MYIFMYTVSIKAFYLSINFIRLVFSPATTNETFLPQIFFFFLPLPFEIGNPRLVYSSPRSRSLASSIFRRVAVQIEEERVARGESSCKIQRKICPAHTRCHCLHVQADARTDAASWDQRFSSERWPLIDNTYLNSKRKLVRENHESLLANIKYLPNILFFNQASRRWRTFPRYNFYKPFMGLCSRIWNMERKRKNLEILFTRR